MNSLIDLQILLVDSPIGTVLPRFCQRIKTGTRNVGSELQCFVLRETLCIIIYI